MRNAAIRAGRTFAQAFLGTLLASGLLSNVADAGLIPDTDFVTKALVSAAAAGTIALLSFLQNVLEESRAGYDRG